MIRDEARHKPDHELTRDDISCSVLYVSQGRILLLLLLFIVV